MTEKEILRILDTIINPSSGAPVGQAAQLEGLSSKGKELKFRLVLPGLNAEHKKYLRGLIEGELGALGYEVFVSIVEHSIENLSRSSTPPPPQKKADGLIDSSVFQHMKSIIAVHSAKGGVGKSTVSVALARAFAARGFKTLLVDLDLYGPSVPRILGTKGEVKVYNDRFVLMEKDGVSSISVGNLIPGTDIPLIWRAPIANGVVKQIFEDTLWEDTFDICVIDMPPGTGDVPISVGQSIPLNGVVAVSTPQAVALEDTVKGIAMFQKMEIPVLGLVKNMSVLICPGCKTPIPLYPKTDEFEAFLQTNRIPLLGDLPLDTVVSAFADKGILEAVDSSSPWAQEVGRIADTLIGRLELSKK